MPFTPYHFGPSGFIGLVFKKWIDLPVFVLANVAVDIEVLLYNRWPVHRYAHTMLIGGAAGALWAVLAYLLRGRLKFFMNKLQLAYKTNFKKIFISAILGVWFHIIIDAVYHWDVRIFWPSEVRPLYKLINQAQVRYLCIAFWILAVALYLFFLYRNIKNQETKK